MVTPFLLKIKAKIENNILYPISRTYASYEIVMSR